MKKLYWGTLIVLIFVEVLLFRNVVVAQNYFNATNQLPHGTSLYGLVVPLGIVLVVIVLNLIILFNPKELAKRRRENE